MTPTTEGLRELLEDSHVSAKAELMAMGEGLAAEVIRLRKELSAATGYLLNAKIDLETGAPKRTALATIEGGLMRARAALNEDEK